MFAISNILFQVDLSGLMESVVDSDEDDEEEEDGDEVSRGFPLL